MRTAWVMLVFGGLVGGASLVALMIVPRRWVWPTFALVLGAVSAGFAGTFAVSMRFARLDVAAATGLLGLIVFALSYSIGTLAAPVLLKAPRSRSSHPVDLECTGGLLAIVSACVEPEHYGPRAFAEILDELDVTGVPLPSWSARPMIFAAERARYQSAGSFSPARSTCAVIARDLAERLGNEGGPDRVDVAWCTLTPRLDQVISDGIRAGFRRVVVANLSVGESLPADRARSMVDGVAGPGSGVQVVYTPPLWGSRVLSDLVVRRAVTAMTDRPRDRVGVCLVGHGQPAEWQASHPTWTEHETYFQQRIRAHLEDAGVSGQNVRVAWLDWIDPDVTETVRHLAALGCELVLVIPSAMPVESLGTLVDLRQSVHLARVPDATDVVVLEAWGRDEAVIDELARLVADARGEFQD